MADAATSRCVQLGLTTAASCTNPVVPLAPVWLSRALEDCGFRVRINQGASGEDDSRLEDDHQNREPATLHDLCARLCSQSNA